MINMAVGQVHGLKQGERGWMRVDEVWAGGDRKLMCAYMQSKSSAAVGNQAARAIAV